MQWTLHRLTSMHTLGSAVSRCCFVLLKCCNKVTTIWFVFIYFFYTHTIYSCKDMDMRIECHQVVQRHKWLWSSTLSTPHSALLYSTLDLTFHRRYFRSLACDILPYIDVRPFVVWTFTRTRNPLPNGKCLKTRKPRRRKNVWAIDMFVCNSMCWRALLISRVLWTPNRTPKLKKLTINLIGNIAFHTFSQLVFFFSSPFFSYGHSPQPKRPHGPSIPPCLKYHAYLVVYVDSRIRY